MCMYVCMVYVHVCMYGMCVYACMCTHVPQHTCGGQRATCKNQFSSATTWVPGIKLRPPGSPANSFTCWITVEGHLHNVQVFLGLCELVKTLSWGQVQSGVWVRNRA